MRIWTKTPFNGIKNGIGNIDRTVGQEGGLSVLVQNRDSGLVLASKKAPTRGGSDLRHKRTVIYCSCDEKWKSLSWDEVKELERQRKEYNAAGGKQIYTAYHYWMHVCMLSKKIFYEVAFSEGFDEGAPAPTFTFQGFEMFDEGAPAPTFTFQGYEMFDTGAYEIWWHSAYTDGFNEGTPQPSWNWSFYEPFDSL